MSRNNRPQQPPPKAPEPKAAEAPPADDDLQSQIAAQMAAAEAASDSPAEAPSVPVDASPVAEDAEPVAEPATSQDEPSGDEPAVAVESRPVRFKLGGLGTLQCDGVTYLPGEALPFSVAQLERYGIEHLAVPVEG